MDMVIYRIEDSDGVGFCTKMSGVHSEFHGELSVWSVVLGNGCSYDTDAQVHPGPDDDDGLMKALNGRDITPYSFAFSSAKQMREWLYRDKWLVALENYGMVVSTYVIDSEHVILGDKQCIYLPDKVSYKTQENISEYFGLDTKMNIKIINYLNKNFLIEDLSNGTQFKMPEKTLIRLLNLNPDVLYPALVDRKYTIGSVAVECN